MAKTNSISLSIVICSRNERYANELKNNIQISAGVECEFIIIKNDANLPIAKVYNKGAYLSSAPFLLFIHEDVRWLSTNWAPKIISKLKETSTGAIGFAGSPNRHNIVTPFSWHTGKETKVTNFVQGNCRVDEYKSNLKKLKLQRTDSPRHQDFVPSVVLDGFAFFVRKEVWNKYPFDESLLTGFHGYDIDFTLTLNHYGYINYVCTDSQIEILHCSMGNFNKAWIESVCGYHKKKWSRMLPVYINIEGLKSPDFHKDIQDCITGMMKRVIKEKDIPLKNFRDIYKKISCGHRLTWSSKLKLLEKFIWYRIIKF